MMVAGRDTVSFNHFGASMAYLMVVVQYRLYLDFMIYHYHTHEDHKIILLLRPSMFIISVFYTSQFNR